MAPGAGQWSGRAPKTNEASTLSYVITIEKWSKPSYAGTSASSVPGMGTKFSVPDKHLLGPTPSTENNWSSSRNQKGAREGVIMCRAILHALRQCK
ncbi:hypothetical protein PCANC_12791 [Puccinia coronata f. sp. avenae]|uniref:Uncharacterized protein n=1 Tax=Puccinia coronata f. sp. avenae TaxID=200324 RepID=A0A2N5T4K6_9BASI|nr:hypothetical protein PCANC_12791 [Puccinia coronata f. sp. avenae]